MEGNFWRLNFKGWHHYDQTIRDSIQHFKEFDLCSLKSNFKGKKKKTSLIRFMLQEDYSGCNECILKARLV